MFLKRAEIFIYKCKLFLCLYIDRYYGKDFYNV